MWPEHGEHCTRGARNVGGSPPGSCSSSSAGSGSNWGHEEAVAAIRDYLTAATAKDCGLMITMQRVQWVEASERGGDEGPAGEIQGLPGPSMSNEIQ